jgi:hypothetical protein
MSEKVLLAYQDTKDKLYPFLKKTTSNYSLYQLIPDRFIQEGKIVEEVLLSISAIRDFPLKLNIKEKCLTYSPFLPIYYELFYNGKQISFNYAIPEVYNDILVNKIKSTYKSATFINREDYFPEFKGKKYCAFRQKKHFLFSLNVDYRENGLIEGFLSLLNNVWQDDKLLFQIGIIPQEDDWKTQWKNAYGRYKNGDKLEISPNIPLTILDGTIKAAESIMGVLDLFVGHEQVKEEQKRDKMYDMMMGFEAGKNKRMTIQKINYSGYQVQLNLYCNNNDRVYYYAKLLDGIFKCLDADQELDIHKTRLYKSQDRQFKYQMHKNIFSTKELSVFMQMPNRRMQIEFKSQLQSIENRETEIPKNLLDKHGLTIGQYTYKGEKQTVFFPADKDNSNYSLLLTGFQRVGKTNDMANYAIEATTKGHSSFVIDTIKNCDLSNTIRDYMPEAYANKIIVLDFSNVDFLLSLAWNEANIENGSSRDKLLKASTLAGSFESFLDTVNVTDDGERLSPKMKRYLSSAVKLTLQHSESTIYDIILCLTDYNKRHELIDKSGLTTNSKTVQDMLMLDDGKCGTNYREIQGVIDRISILMNDYYLELFLSTPVNPKINFKYWADNGYCVLLKIPELNFSPVAINCIVTFLFAKIWLSILNRVGDVAKLPHVHVVCDEIHKYNQVTKLLVNWIREAAKYKTNFVISAHTLIDLKCLLPVFKAAGSHYKVYKSSPQNYKMLENELLPFSMEELMQIKPFHSVNCVNYNRDYAIFITQSLGRVEDLYIKHNRSFMDLQHSKIYGCEYQI